MYIYILLGLLGIYTYYISTYIYTIDHIDIAQPLTYLASRLGVQQRYLLGGKLYTPRKLT